MIVFLDLETTGLDATKHSVLEVAAVVTDDTLVEVARFARVVRWQASEYMLGEHATSRALHFGVDPVILQMHVENGLWMASATSGNSLLEVEQDLAELIRQHCPDARSDDARTGPQLAGNTIDFDRAFLKDELPEVHALLHYRSIDCTTMNELAKRFWPKLFADRPRAKGAHRAMSDVLESVETARYYAGALRPREKLTAADLERQENPL